MNNIVNIWKHLVPVGLFVFTFLIFSNIADYTYLKGLQPLPPRWVLLVPIIILLPVVAEAIQNLRIRPLLPVGIYITVSVTIYLISLYINYTPSNQALFRTQAIEMLFFFFCCFIFLKEENRRYAGYGVIACLFVGVVINLLEVIHPGFFIAIGGRSAGFYGNPNISGLALVLGWMLVQESISNKYKTTVTILIGAGVLSTLSRTAIAIYLILVIVLLHKGSLSHGRKNWGINLILIVALGAYFFCGYQNNSEFRFALDSQTGGITRNFTEVEADSQNQTPVSGKHYVSEPAVKVLASVAQQPGNIKTVDSVLATEIENNIQETLNKEYSDDSLSARAFLWANGINAIKQHLMWGIGMEKAWAMSPHNMYLLMGLAYGVPGWLIFPAFCLLIALVGKTSKGSSVALVLLLAGGFSHNLLVDRTVLLPAALALMSTGLYPQSIDI